jgi:hypothetical protein
MAGRDLDAGHDENTGDVFYPLHSVLTHVLGSTSNSSKSVKQSLTRNSNVFSTQFGHIFSQCTQRTLGDLQRIWIPESLLVLELLPLLLCWSRDHHQDRKHRGPLVTANITSLFELSLNKRGTDTINFDNVVHNSSLILDPSVRSELKIAQDKHKEITGVESTSKNLPWLEKRRTPKNRAARKANAGSPFMFPPSPSKNENLTDPIEHESPVPVDISVVGVLDSDTLLDTTHNQLATRDLTPLQRFTKAAKEKRTAREKTQFRSVHIDTDGSAYHGM